MIRRRFQRRTFDNLHAPGFLTSRTLLRSSLDREDQDADRNRDREQK
jgi:hypothetical protein